MGMPDQHQIKTVLAINVLHLRPVDQEDGIGTVLCLCGDLCYPLPEAALPALGESAAIRPGIRVVYSSDADPASVDFHRGNLAAEADNPAFFQNKLYSICTHQDTKIPGNPHKYWVSGGMRCLFPFDRRDGLGA